MAAAAALGRKPGAFQPPRRQRRRTGRSLELLGCHSYSGGPLRARPTLAEALLEPSEHPGLRARGPGSSVCQLGGIQAVATTAVVGRVPSGLPSVAWTLSSLCGRAFVCAQDLNGELPSFRWAPSHLRVLRIGSDWTTAAPLTDSPELRRGGSMESTAARAWKAAGSSLSLASSLQPPQIRPARCLLRVPSFAPFCQMSTQMHAAPRAGYVLGRTADEPGNSFGAGAWPVLCGAIQGAAILVAWMHVMREAGRSLRWEVLACEAQPVFVAARLVVAERLLMPLAFILPLWGTFLLLLGLLFLEQFVRVGLLVATKWLLIGRYKEGEHDIYSLMYLRHWLVEHLAKGTIVGQNAHQGSSIAFLFMRNLALKALGADVSLSSVITARVVAFDLVSVGDLATVHGPRHLTAVNYGSRRMVLQRVKVGAGAYVGPNCTLEPGCEVALLWVLLRLLLLLLLLLHLSPSKAPSCQVTAAGYVEPLSTVSCGTIVTGRVCGVPAQPVAGHDPARLPTQAEARRFRRVAAAFATGYWFLLLPKALVPFLGVFFLQLSRGVQLFCLSAVGASLRLCLRGARPRLSSDYPSNRPEQLDEHLLRREHAAPRPNAGTGRSICKLTRSQATHR